MEVNTGLSTLGEVEERSTLEINTQEQSTTEINIQENHQNQEQEESDPFDELDDPAPSVKKDANKFRMLCDHVENSFSEIDNSMFELLELKDNLLLQFLPANVTTRITLVVSRLYRAYSLSQIPVNELVRLAQLYSQPFDMKSVALKKLFDNNETKKRMLNIALQRITSMENGTKRHQHMRCVNNWEKMYIRLALPRSNVRKWKFRLKTFREISNLGYEHVISWLNENSLRPASASDFSKDEHGDDGERADGERIEESGDFVPGQDGGEQQRIEQGSDFGDEIESDNEGSFLSSAGKQKTKQSMGSVNVGDVKQAEQQQVEQPIITKVDVEIQVKPDYDNQQTATGDILSTTSLIMRIYRPVGLVKSKFQYVVHAHGKDYKTIAFTFDKSNSSKDESSKTKGRTTTRITKPVDSKTKKRTGDSTTPEETDINSIDKSQHDEFVIPMPTILKRRSLFSSDTDPDSIQIDLHGDDKPSGSLVLSPEDLRMLELPKLNSPTTAPLITIDDSTTNPTKPVVKTEKIDFDQSSNEVFKSWTSRTPQTFSVYNEKREEIAKLPLHLFWYNQVEITHATKCTMTPPMQIRAATPQTVYVPQVTPSVETQEKAVSTIITSTPIVADESTEAAASRLGVSNEQIENLKIIYEDQISKLHESYQAEIIRLTKLLSEGQLHQSNQMADLSELEDSTREIVEDETANVNTRRKIRQVKRDETMENQPTPVYGKGLPKNFLDRYHMFLQRSAAHRNQLTSKIEQETARANERQMEIQHRLHRPEQNDERYDDLCLPAVFMPFRSGNVFNPRAYRYFHHIGSTDPRLTQTPSIFKLPPLPSGSVSVLNLFELSRCYEAANEKDRSADKTTSQSSQPPAPPTTQTSN